MASQRLLLGLIGSNTIEGLNMDLPSDSDSSSDDENEQIGEEGRTKAKRTLGYKRAAPGTYDPTTGKTERVDPVQQSWYRWYVLTKDIPRHQVPKKSRIKFRRRFGMPMHKFREFIKITEDEKWFEKYAYGKPDATGKVHTYIDLLILGSLRYMRRGWTFDDLEEATGISEETHRQFFHIFVKEVAERFFPKHVRPPTTDAEIDACRAPYTAAGLDGCLGSSDATHIVIEQCAAGLKNSNVGGKTKQATRVFNLVVNHR